MRFTAWNHLCSSLLTHSISYYYPLRPLQRSRNLFFKSHPLPQKSSRSNGNRPVYFIVIIWELFSASKTTTLFLIQFVEINTPSTLLFFIILLHVINEITVIIRQGKNMKKSWPNSGCRDAPGSLTINCTDCNVVTWHFQRLKSANVLRRKKKKHWREWRANCQHKKTVKTNERHDTFQSNLLVCH